MGLFEKRRAAKFFSFCQQYDERNPQVGAAGRATRAPMAAAAAAARAPAYNVAGKEGLTGWQPWPAALASDASRCSFHQLLIHLPGRGTDVAQLGPVPHDHARALHAVWAGRAGAALGWSIGQLCTAAAVHRVAERRLQPGGRHRMCGCAQRLVSSSVLCTVLHGSHLTWHGSHSPARRPSTSWATPLRCIRTTPT